MQQAQLNPFEQALKTYLDQRAQDDPLFAQSYAKPKKSIQECARYCMQEARKLVKDNVAVVDNATVYGWAVHYYNEDNIKVTGNYSKYMPRYHTPQRWNLPSRRKQRQRKLPWNARSRSSVSNYTPRTKKPLKTKKTSLYKHLYSTCYETKNKKASGDNETPC